MKTLSFPYNFVALDHLDAAKVEEGQSTPIDILIEKPHPLLDEGALILASSINASHVFIIKGIDSRGTS